MLDKEQIEMWDTDARPVVGLKWITPDAEKTIVEIARVSSDPKKRSSPDHVLIGYLLKNHHWSPFEMANICFEVNTTRDIGRQMLRHWTMRPQEFSQRYQNVGVLDGPVFRECRRQHPTNRQAALPSNDIHDNAWWLAAQEGVWAEANEAYQSALHRGVAKEVARAVLPEGITPTRLYFNAPIRSALHFCGLRLGHGSQKEITEIAQALHDLLKAHMPHVVRAFDDHRKAEEEVRALVEWRDKNPVDWYRLLGSIDGLNLDGLERS